MIEAVLVDVSWRSAIGKKTSNEMAPAAVFSQLFFDRLCEIGPPPIREVLRQYLLRSYV